MAYSGTSAAILANYDEVLKTIYLPAIQEQLNQDTPLADMIEVNEKDVEGKYAKIECHYGRSSGTGSRADGGTLPEADYQKHKMATVPMKYHYGRITVSGPTIAATRTDRGAYARVLDTEIRGIVKDVMKDMNRQYWGCGYSVLCRWVSGATTSVVVAKKYYGNSVGGDGFGSTFGGKYLEENTKCNVNIAAHGAANTADFAPDSTELTVSAITKGSIYDTLTITDADATEAAGSWYSRVGNTREIAHTSESGYGRLEMMGLAGIVTDVDPDHVVGFDGTNCGAPAATASWGFYYNGSGDPLQGLSTDTYSWWKANVLTHASGRYFGQRPLSLDLMQQAFDITELKAGIGVGPSLILSTQAMRREYLRICQADRRTVNKMTLDGGWSALDYNGVPFMVDPQDAIDGEIEFLTLADLQLYRMSDYDWMQKDGAILSRITGYDAYEAVLYRYAELGCTRRNTQTVLCDLSYTAT